MPITQQKLNETFNLYKARFEGKKEDYFGALYLAEKHNLSLEDAFAYTVFGNNDYGIDGFYIDRAAKNLYLYQFKWSENHEQFKPSYERLISDGMEMLFGNPGQDNNLNKTIRLLKYELTEFKSVIEKVYILFVFNGEIEKASGSKVLESLREDLENKRYFIDSYFNREDIAFSIDYKSNTSRAAFSTSVTRRTNVFQVRFHSEQVFLAPKGECLQIGLLHLMDLYNMYLLMRSRLFEKNIRSGLSPENPPNRAIKRSFKEIIIDKTTDAEYFTFNHNGVTLYAEKVVREDGMAKIIEPRILNGAQTLTTFARFMEDNHTHPKLSENREILDSVKVMAKIITDARPEFVTQVTICNNRQNPVDPWNLRASDLLQCQFEDKFNGHGNGIHYDRQEGAFKNMTDEEREEKGILESKEINIKKLAQAFLALQGEVDKISRMTEVFENENLYKSTFRSDYLKADTRKIILIYKIHFRISSIVRSIEEKGYSKYHWASHAKNLIWALLIQGILNDPDIEGLCEDFGFTMTSETNYSEQLKEIASKRIRFILSDLTEMPKYQELLSGDPPKYSFFKTKVIFTEAMQIARKKYGWTKLGLD